MDLKKKARAAALLALCLVMLLALAGCGNSGAKKKIAADAAERLEAIVSGDYSSLAYLAVGLDADGLAEYGVDETELLVAFLDGFSYEVGDVTVSGSTAIVSVTLTCKSYAEFYEAFEDAVFDIALDNSSASDSKLAALYCEALYEALADASHVTINVELTYEKIDKTWYPTDDYEQMLAEALLSA